MRIKYISKKIIENSCISYKDMSEVIKKTILEKKNGLIELPPKPAVYPREDSFINFMPAYLKASDVSGMKLVSYCPSNSRLGLPTINSIIMLCDAETGVPKLLMDGNWITAYRTAIVSAITAELLNADIDAVSLIGSGVQAESHIDLFSTLFDVKEIYIYSRNLKKAEDLIYKMSRKFSKIKFEIKDKDECLMEGDVIISATPISKSIEPFLDVDKTKKSAKILPIDYACSWSKEIYEKNKVIVTDDKIQFQNYYKAGYFKGFSDENLLIDLSDLNGMVNCKLAINLGIGAFDLALANYIAGKIERHEEIEL